MDSVCVNGHGVVVKSPLDALTKRELDVMQELAKGYSNQQIADALQIRERTVRTHVSNIIGKLGVGSRTEALARMGWVRPPTSTDERTLLAFRECLQEAMTFIEEIIKHE